MLQPMSHHDGLSHEHILFEELFQQLLDFLLSFVQVLGRVLKQRYGLWEQFGRKDARPNRSMSLGQLQAEGSGLSRCSAINASREWVSMDCSRDKQGDAWLESRGRSPNHYAEQSRCRTELVISLT